MDKLPKIIIDVFVFIFVFGSMIYNAFIENNIMMTIVLGVCSILVYIQVAIDQINKGE